MYRSHFLYDFFLVSYIIAGEFWHTVLYNDAPVHIDFFEHLQSQTNRKTDISLECFSHSSRKNFHCRKVNSKLIGNHFITLSRLMCSNICFSKVILYVISNWHCVNTQLNAPEKCLIVCSYESSAHLLMISSLRIND